MRQGCKKLRSPPAPAPRGPNTPFLTPSAKNLPLGLLEPLPGICSLCLLGLKSNCPQTSFPGAPTPSYPGLLLWGLQYHLCVAKPVASPKTSSFFAHQCLSSLCRLLLISWSAFCFVPVPKPQARPLVSFPNPAPLRVARCICCLSPAQKAPHRCPETFQPQQKPQKGPLPGRAFLGGETVGQGCQGGSAGHTHLEHSK